MFKKVNWFLTLIAATTAAVVFSIPVFFYLYDATYRESWLLFLGNFLFLVVIWIHTLRDNKKRSQNESTVSMVFASHMATISGVLISCLLCFLLLIFLVPGYLDSGMAGKTLTDEPANIIHDKTGGLSFEVFLSATVINFSVGSFAGIILPFYSKRNQTRDSREPTPLHQRGLQ